MKTGIPFLVSLLCGGLSLFILGRNDSTFLIAPLLTIGCMGAYLGWILWTVRVSGNYDKYSDSFYYLGFMLTLITLLVALFQSQGPQVDVGAILAKFGVGLITTLFGLGGRVFLSEFGGGVDEIEEDLVSRIRESSQTLATNLEMSASVLVETHRAIIASTTAHNEAMSRSVADTVSSITGRLNSLGEQIGSAGENLRNSANSSSRVLLESTESAMQGIKSTGITALSDIRKTTGDFATAVIKTLDELKERVSKVEVPADLVQRMLAKALSGVEKELRTFEVSVSQLTQQTGSVTSALSEISSNFVMTTAQMNTLASDSGTISKINHNLHEFESSLAQFATKISGFHATFAQLLSTIETTALLAKGQVEETLTAVGHLQRQLDGEVQRSMDATRKVHQSLVESVKFVNEKLG